LDKKTLIISQHFYPEIGSAGNRMKNLYQLLESEGYKFDVLTIDPSYPNKNLYKNDIFWDDMEFNNEPENVLRIKTKTRKYSKSMLKRLMLYWEVSTKFLFEVIKRKRQYDYIYVTSPPIFIALVGLVAKHRYKAKLILEIRDLWPESLKGVKVFNSRFILSTFGMFEKVLYKKAEKVIVNSKGFINYIEKKEPSTKGKIYYIPNAARKYEVSLTEKNKDDFKVIYTGNVGLAQDAGFLEQLAIKLNENKIKFTIIGYGVKFNDFKEFIHNRKLEYVSFVNPLTRKLCLREIEEHNVGIVTLNNSDVFDTVLPGKVVDYLTCGLPIIGSVSGNTKHLIETHQVGHVSKERDVNEIIEYIIKIKESPYLQREFSTNCNKLIHEQFLWEKNFRIFKEIIQ